MGEVEKVAKLFCGSIKIVHDKFNLILIYLYIYIFFQLEKASTIHSIDIGK